jgi:hypothetical protein
MAAARRGCSFVTCGRRERRSSWYTSAPFASPAGAMIEVNPLRHRIADLEARVESLRGYL